MQDQGARVDCALSAGSRLVRLWSVVARSSAVSSTCWRPTSRSMSVHGPAFNAWLISRRPVYPTHDTSHARLRRDDAAPSHSVSAETKAAGLHHRGEGGWSSSARSAETAASCTTSAELIWIPRSNRVPVPAHGEPSVYPKLSRTDLDGCFTIPDTACGATYAYEGCRYAGRGARSKDGGEGRWRSNKTCASAVMVLQPISTTGVGATARCVHPANAAVFEPDGGGSGVVSGDCAQPSWAQPIRTRSRAARN